MPNNKNTTDPLVLLATAPNEPVALMWKEILESEGIPSMVKRNAPAWLLYAQSVMLPCELYVLASQQEKAKEILDSLREDASTSFEELNEEQGEQS